MPSPNHYLHRKAFVLLSGGLDSTTALYKAIYDFCPRDLSHGYGDSEILKDWLQKREQEPFYDPRSGKIAGDDSQNIDWVEAVSINYGQRHIKETEYAKRTCDALGIRHSVIDVGSLLSGPQVMLTDPSVQVPDIAYSDIKGVSPTYVPFRNGLMLSTIVAHAQKYVNSEIEAAIVGNPNESAVDHSELREYYTEQARDLCGVYFGAHSEDAANWAYPDCTPEFIGSMANAIYIGSYQSIRLYTPLQWLFKSEVVELGDKLGVPFENTWSCYKGEDLQCGVCPTCRSRREAFITAHVKDPTTYAGGNSKVPGENSQATDGKGVSSRPEART